MLSFWKRTKELIDTQKTNWIWLANTTSILQPTLSQWINKDRLPDVEDGQKIAQALGVTVEYLITGADPAKPDASPLIAQAEALLEGLKKL